MVRGRVAAGRQEGDEDELMVHTGIKARMRTESR